MGYRLNLDLSPRNFIHRGVQVFLNWSDVAGEMEPAFVFRKAGNGRSVFILPMSYLHQVVQSSGFGALALAAESAAIAEAIGFERLDRSAAMAVADLIVERAEDLLDMPPEPPAAPVAEAGPKAELAIQIDGQTVLETEVAA